MNTPNPMKSDSSLAEQKNKSRTRVRVAIISVLALHVVVLVPLLVQGCKRQEETAPPVAETNLPPLAVEETNLPPTDLSHPSVALPPFAPATNVMTSVPPMTTTVAPAEGTTYTVVKGDSFFSIGKKYGVSIKAISEANPGVDSSHLKIGQKLNVPAAVAHEAAVSGRAMEAATGEVVYVVKSGDTLMRIARQHGTTYKAIKAANGLVTDKIKVGQKLKIPLKEAAAPTGTLEPAPAPAAPTVPPPLVPALPPPPTTTTTH